MSRGSAPIPGRRFAALPTCTASRSGRSRAASSVSPNHRSAHLAYLEGRHAVERLIERHGEAGIRALLTEMSTGAPFAAAFERALGEDYGTFAATFDAEGAPLIVRRPMDLELKGRRALVSGSTAGIGWAIAAGLAAEGAEVVLNGRTEARVEAAVRAVRERHPAARVRGVAADLGTAEGCARVVREMSEVDVLVNNLGIFAAVPFEDIADADWMRFFEVNVLSGVRLSRAYLPGMKARNWGRILFISSESALQIPVEMIHYGTTKTAQLAVSRGLAETTRGTGVTVNAILAGPTRSEGVEGFVEGLAAQQGVPAGPGGARLLLHRPAHLAPPALRHARGGRVAHRLRLLGPASAVNGAALRVDGGVVRAIV